MKLKKSAGWYRSLLMLSLSAMVSSCGGGGGSNSGGPLSSGSSNIAVTVTPASATLAPGGTQLYTASVTGTTDTTVTWSAGGVQGGNATIGTISSSGLYTAPAAPPNPSNVTITAVSVADSTKSGTAVADIRVHHDNQDPQSGPIKLGTSGGNSTDKTTTVVPEPTALKAANKVLDTKRISKKINYSAIDDLFDPKKISI